MSSGDQFGVSPDKDDEKIPFALAAMQLKSDEVPHTLPPIRAQFATATTAVPAGTVSKPQNTVPAWTLPSA